MRRGWLGDHKLLFALLGASWLARIALCAGGGQFYSADENRFSQAFRILYTLSQGDALGALDVLLRIPMHVGFVLIGLVPASIHSAAVMAVGLPGKWTSFVETMWLTAAMVSLASVVCIGLTYALARRLKAPTGEALLAAFLLACTASLFYYSRHLLPYDSALALTLWGLYIGLEERPSGRRSLACGAILGLAVMTHLGHWPTVFAAAGAHALYRTRGWKDSARRAAAMGLTAPLLPLLLALLAYLRGLPSYIGAVRAFMGDVLGYTFGDFSEGWSLPWAHFWHAEHGLLLVWALGAAAALRWGRREDGSRRRALVWLSVAAGLYVLLLLLCLGTRTFVVQARVSRGMAPFLCLAAAAGFQRLLELRRPSRPMVAAALGAVLIQAGFNFATPLRNRFPAEVRREVAARYGRVSHATTIAGSFWEEPDDRTLPYVLVNAQDFFPVAGRREAPAGETLFRLRHPLQYLPWQYDNYKPEERAILRTTDISMRLIRRAPAAGPK